MGATVVAAAGSTVAFVHRGGHMGDDDTAWMWVFGPVMMILGIALIALLVWWLTTRADRPRIPGPEAGQGPVTPEEVLAMRYARGELSTEEYREAVEQLRSRHRE
ncbi:SHOCT domain-containing protein [Yinghuangia seranimata]|uniref:SHOCT domain-containing protein n=1 Tax=Yinghuangia seranimata TaxID=408067 RepID=UPI00248CF036|nr:SHOCT domain-containing protein [Yinghuangia seranimata]MDI2125459.1 SHOCT domain-containing protein [Yinghuangia seranimata]